MRVVRGLSGSILRCYLLDLVHGMCEECPTSGDSGHSSTCHEYYHQAHHTMVVSTHVLRRHAVPSQHEWYHLVLVALMVVLIPEMGPPISGTVRSTTTWTHGTTSPVGSADPLVRPRDDMGWDDVAARVEPDLAHIIHIPSSLGHPLSSTLDD